MSSSRSWRPGSFLKACPPCSHFGLEEERREGPIRGPGTLGPTLPGPRPQGRREGGASGVFRSRPAPPLGASPRAARGPGAGGALPARGRRVRAEPSAARPPPGGCGRGRVWARQPHRGFVLLADLEGPFTERGAHSESSRLQMSRCVASPRRQPVFVWRVQLRVQLLPFPGHSPRTALVVLCSSQM